MAAGAMQGVMSGKIPGVPSSASSALSDLLGGKKQPK
jgi:hypothetical protein